MKVANRQQSILNWLAAADTPVGASVLAVNFGVSRQIIVKDIAALREQGYPVVSTARGYMLYEKPQCRRVFKTQHSDEDVEKELNLIVDLGGEVLDVFIFHKFYNQLRAPMHIKSRRDVAHFLKNISEGKSSLLKNVTAGYHYHTVAADSEQMLNEIEKALKNAGFLAPLQAYEPSELLNNE